MYKPQFSGTEILNNFFVAFKFTVFIKNALLFECSGIIDINNSDIFSTVQYWQYFKDKRSSISNCLNSKLLKFEKNYILTQLYGQTFAKKDAINRTFELDCQGRKIVTWNESNLQSFFLNFNMNTTYASALRNFSQMGVKR